VKKITSLVISLHIIFILALLFSPAQKTPLPKKHIAVRTVVPTVKMPARPKPAPAKAPATSKTVTPPKKTPPAPPKSSPPAKKPVAAEKNKPRKSPAVKAPPVAREEKEPLAKIEEKLYTPPRLQLVVPKIEEPPSQEGSQSEEVLVAFLHGTLNLPEFGDVKIQLTLNRDGSVAKVVVVQAESKKNRAYLEDHLPCLKFPLILEQEKTFTLTFCNEL
jgi:hypothetical protein